MIPYEDLEKALFRWKSRLHDGAAPEATGEAEEDLGTGPRYASGFPPPPEQTGEIDMNDEVVESVVDIHQH